MQCPQRLRGFDKRTTSLTSSACPEGNSGLRNAHRLADVRLLFINNQRNLSPDGQKVEKSVSEACAQTSWKHFWHHALTTSGPLVGPPVFGLKDRIRDPGASSSIFWWGGGQWAMRDGAMGGFWSIPNQYKIIP